MQFDNGLSLFQHLLSLEEGNLRDNLAAIPAVPDAIVEEVLALISAHEKNQASKSGFTHLIGTQAHYFSDDNVLHDLEGQQVGVFKLVRRLGSGGMGVVYLGERNDGKIQQQVALKFVYPSISHLAGESFIQQEAQYLADLNHPNIAKIYSLECSENGLSYILMEYVKGEPLDKYVAKHRGIKQALHILMKLANALDSAHQRSIVHADVKPSNIILDDIGEPKLLDFGVASSKDTQDLDRLSAVSSNFASPSVCSGAKPTPLDDIYSLGKVMESVLKPYTLSAEYQAVINKAVEIEPCARFQSMREFESAILALINNRPLYWYRSSFLYLYKKWFERSPISASAVALLPFVFVISTIVVSFKNAELEQEIVKNRELVDFYNGLFLTHSPTSQSGNVITAADFIGTGVDVALAQPMNDDETRVTVLTTLARSLIKLGFLSRASQISAQLSNGDPQTFLLKSIVAFEQQHYGRAKQLLGQYHETFSPTLDSELLALKIQMAQDPSASVSTPLQKIVQKYADIADPQMRFELVRLQWESTLATSPELFIAHFNSILATVNDEYQQSWVFALSASAHVRLGELEKASDDMLQSLRLSETAFNPGNPVYSLLLERLFDVAARLEDGRTAAILLGKKQSLYEYLSPIFDEKLLDTYERQINLHANAKTWAQSVSFALKALALCDTSNSAQCMRVKLKHSIALYSIHKYQDAFDTSSALMNGELPSEQHFYAYLVYLNSRIGIGLSNSQEMLDELAENPLASIQPDKVMAAAIRSDQVTWAVEFGKANMESLSGRGLFTLADALTLLEKHEEARFINNLADAKFENNQISRGISLAAETIIPFDTQNEQVFELEGGNNIISSRRVNSIISPSHQSTLTIGEPYTIAWDPNTLIGETLTFYINHTMHFSVSGAVLWENVKQTQWQMFSRLDSNSGFMEIDPHVMMANGVGGFKVLAVSDKGYWSLSDGMFTVNTGTSTDMGLRQQINPLLLVDAVDMPRANDVYLVGEKNQITWDPTILKGDHVRIYVLHDNPLNIGSGMFAQYETILSKRWYLVTGHHDNTGVYELDPAQFNGQGNAYKILIFTDTGYWSVSEERFSVVNPH